MSKRSRTREMVPEGTPPNATSSGYVLPPLPDDWGAHFGRGSTAHTSATNLSPVFGNDVSPIPHCSRDVSQCAHSDPNSPPKAAEGTSDGEMSIDDDEEPSGRTNMPFESFGHDLCEPSDHDSNVEAHTGARGRRVGPESRSRPSKETNTSSCGPQYQRYTEKFVQ